MMNQESRRLAAEKIRQEFIESKRLEIPSKRIYPRIVRPLPTIPDK